MKDGKQTRHCVPQRRFQTSATLLWIQLLVSSLLQQAVSYSPSTSRDKQVERTVVLLYNKPANVVTTHATDTHGRLNVYQDIQSVKGFVDKNGVKQQDPNLTFEQVTGSKLKFHAIGRLDAETTGLLLITNDGGLIHHVTNRDAKTHGQLGGGPISKTYQALIMGYHEDSSPILEEMRTSGVDIGKKYGGMTKPVDHVCVLDHPTLKTTLVSLTISEGKNRQVRRMFHALGSGVMKLHRARIGDDLTSDGLEEGEWRILSDHEVNSALNWQPRQLVVEKPTRNHQPTKKRRQSRRNRLR